MKKFISLIKASFTEDMNIFKYKTKANTSKFKKLLFPLFITLLLMYCSGVYAYFFAETLHEVNLTYVMLTLFMLVVVLITLVEGTYKSQGILFDCKDNDLLFSLPIDKSKIFALRILKMLTFQFIYNLIIILPAFIIYIYFENPGITYYISSIIMLFLLPIIPTIIAVLFGYLIKDISVKFKAKKLVQTILSLILVLAIFYLSYNMNNLLSNIASEAKSINDIINKLYYPIGLYISLITDFKLSRLLLLILINIIPLVIIIYIGAINYFKIITKSNSHNSVEKIYNDNQIKVNYPIVSLVKKELSRFFSIPVYMLNTLFGVVLLLILTILMCTSLESAINLAMQGQELMISTDFIKEIIHIIYIELLVVTGSLTFITSSSISLEGKSFNITKSLPVKEEKILLSKIITSDIICLPLILISDIIFIVNYNPSIINILYIFGYSLLVPTFIATIGILINLKYPKMLYSSETEVVKQSMSTIISTFLGMIIAMSSIGISFYFFDIIKIIIPLKLLIFLLLTIITWIIIKKVGIKMFKKINV